MKKSIVICLLTFLLLPRQSALAGNLDQELTKIINNHSEEYLKNYLAPFSEAISANVATALYFRAGVEEFPHFNIGLNLTSSIIPQKSKNFSESGESAATIFGAKSSDDQKISGFNLDRVVLPIIQVNVGLFANFEFNLRYTNWELDNIGKINLLGVGIKYELIDILPISKFPVNMSIIALYHSITMSDYIESGAFGVNINISRQIPSIPVEFYAGISYNKNILTIDTAQIVDNNVLGNVTINEFDEVRYQLGLGFNVYIVNLHVDYNIGSYNSWSLGISFGL